MPQTKRVSVAVRANQLHICTIPGCSEHRHSMSPYCRRHKDNARRWGDPLAAPVRPSQWSPYRDKVRAVYAANPDHAGLTRATQLLQGWLLNAVCLDGREAWATEAARLQRHGVSPLDILIELSAVYCLLADQPRVARSDDHRSWVYSKAVLQLVPRVRVFTQETNLKGGTGYAKKPKPAALRRIGPELVKSLAPVLVATHQALQHQQDLARAEVETLRSPFLHVPTQAIQAVIHQEPL